MKGKDLKAWRESIGWTQANLMAELGVTSRQTIYNWELSEHVPRIVQLAVYAIDQIEACRNHAAYESYFSARDITLLRKCATAKHFEDVGG